MKIVDQEKELRDMIAKHKKGTATFVTLAIIVVSAMISATVLYNLIG